MKRLNVGNYLKSCIWCFECSQVSFQAVIIVILFWICISNQLEAILELDEVLLRYSLLGLRCHGNCNVLNPQL